MPGFRAGLGSFVLWGAVALVSIGVTLCAVLPAAWVAPELGEATGGSLSLRDVEGSVWSGSGQLVVGSAGDVEEARELPGRLSWHASPAGLLSGRLAVELRAPAILAQPVVLVVERNTLSIGPGHLTLPLEMFRALGAPFNTLDFSGGLVCDWGPWQIEAARTTGHAEMRLVDLSSRLSAVRPLGSYRLTLNGQASVVALEVRTDTGPLLIDAQGSVSSQGIELRGKAQAAPDAQEQLADVLGILGRKEAGAVTFSFGGLK
jgi:general secretion pathway protein N